MALVQCDFCSKSLKLETQLNAIFPEANIDSMKKYPVLYLLHGLSGDHKEWQRKTSLERYVKEKELVIIMPNVHRSFYSDMEIGYKYWEFISKELPAISQAFFPISTKREDTFVAGLSMGGFGAFKLAFNYPEKFSKAASLSGALHMLNYIKEIEEHIKKGEESQLQHADIFGVNECLNVFGSYQKMKKSNNDLLYLIDKNLNEGKELPKLFQCCGTEDSLYEENLFFRDYMMKNNLNLRYEEGPGDHTWEYWDEMIQKVIEWLDI